VRSLKVHHIRAIAENELNVQERLFDVPDGGNIKSRKNNTKHQED
jgi:hypothetical protein